MDEDELNKELEEMENELMDSQLLAAPDVPVTNVRPTQTIAAETTKTEAVASTPPAQTTTTTAATTRQVVMAGGAAPAASSSSSSSSGKKQLSEKEQREMKELEALMGM